MHVSPGHARQVLGWMGKFSLRCGKAGVGSGIPGPITRLGPWGSQALGHTEAPGSYRRAENREEDYRLGTAWGCSRGGWRRREASASPLVIVLDLMGSRLSGSCGWECGEVFYRRLDRSSVGKGLLHCSPQQMPMKRESLWFQKIYCHDEIWMYKSIPHFSGWA